jgi:flagellar biosynthesis protein FlhG
MISTVWDIRALIADQSDQIARHAPTYRGDPRQGQRQHPAPKVIAVSGGKGGVGKTLLTANLAYSCATLGQRTLVIDGDLGLSNLDVIMNLRPRGSIDDVLAGECTIADVIVPYAQGLDLLPASSGFLKVAELDRVHKLILLEQIEALDGLYDLILIDCPAGVSRTVQHWAASAGQIVVVVTPEPTSLADGYATMKILSATIGESHFSLVVNMASSEREALDVYERFSTVSEEFLGAKVKYLGAVPQDAAARQSVLQRSLLSRNLPFSSAAVAINSVAAQICMNSDARPAKGTAQFFWRKMVNYGLGDATW